MNGYLVLLIHTMDDIPVGLFADLTVATEYALERTWRLTREEAAKFDRDGSEPVAVVIVQFKGGVLQDMLTVKVHEEE